MSRVCNNCSGRGGYYDRPNGERYLSDEGDGTPWTKCPDCDGTGEEAQPCKELTDTYCHRWGIRNIIKEY